MVCRVNSEQRVLELKNRTQKTIHLEIDIKFRMKKKKKKKGFNYKEGSFEKEKKKNLPFQFHNGVPYAQSFH